MVAEILNKILLLTILVLPTAYVLLIFARSRSHLKDSIPALLGFVTLALLFLNKLLFAGQTLAAQDFNNIQITFFEFFRSSILTYGQPPIWNSRFGGGFDVFANPIASYFSVFNWVFLLFKNVYIGANYFIFFQVLLALVFSYLMFREMNMRKPVSFFGAILFGFNGFVTMRLSPGVGIEYLYSYKWLPLIILFSHSVFKNGRRSDLPLLAVSMAFVLEGNTNIAISIWVLWFLYVITLTRGKFFSYWKEFIQLAGLSFLVYGVKLLPFIDLMTHGSGRLNEIVTGWRISRLEFWEVPSYYLPFSHTFGTSIFTLGVIGTLLSMFGLVYLLIVSVKDKHLNGSLGFPLLSTAVGILLVTNNPVSFFVFSLPVFNRLTILPAFVIFLLMPMVLLGAEGVKAFVSLVHIRYVPFAVPVFIALAVFAEVLTGPSTFGPGTYSFNFAKMDTHEYKDIPYYSALKALPRGNFMFISDSSVFLFPYGVELNDLYTLNSFKYFYGMPNDKDILKKLSLKEVAARVDYIVSSTPLNENYLTLVKQVSTAKLLDGFKSHAILEKKYDYLALQGKLNWEEALYIYKVDPQTSIIPRDLSIDPVHVEVNTFPTGETSITYSKWWRTSKGRTLASDELGYISTWGFAERSLMLTYMNWAIYGGMLLSVLAAPLVYYLSSKKC